MTTDLQRATVERLADTLVDGDVRDLTVAQTLALVLQQLAPDLALVVEQPSLLADPAVTRAVFPNIPLRDVLRSLVAAAGGNVDVLPDGSVLIRPTTPAELVARQKALALGQLEMYGTDREGERIVVGDRVRVLHQDDPETAWLVGVEGVVEWIEGASVVVVLSDPRASKATTFQAWVRKVQVIPHGR